MNDILLFFTVAAILTVIIGGLWYFKKRGKSLNDGIHGAKPVEKDGE